ncbi:SAV_2336 N-terminal domain-related protein [Streptomyces sp. MUM 178J]|uniref:SAV_2336 N-terminal domain-related protein n=1 Tax=Streptomyces sp. MUM 178J TaxID=2791991 RepID=UPI001F04827F|nr:SAV_2336 N-terminal domain-related protein [Streptomyces sp. MUM 178J]WRQ78281.1 SAV_2336 N-terminal domain-related protein [Streptomyces sp. MUM 178J]
MAPGPSRRADRLTSALRALGDAGCDLDLPEVLDVLWLSRRMPAAYELPLARVHGTGPPAGGTLPEPRTTGDDSNAASQASEQADRAAHEGDRARLTAGGPMASPDGGSRRPHRDGAAARRPSPSDRSMPPERTALPLRVPEDKALPDQLPIGRALRPLKQKRPSRRRQELDEPATAATLAETGVPDVVMRPARERWLNLVVAVDDGLSMLLWRRLAAELRTMMQRLGAFRSIQVYGLDTRTVGAPQLRGRPFDPDSARLPPALAVDPSGQTLVLAVSDGMGPAWRHGAMHDVLLGWAAVGPAAVVHALPTQLWDSSGIQAERWLATTRHRGGASTAWEITDRLLPAGLVDYAGVPIPVLEPSSGPMGDWARLITSPGTTVELPLLSRPRGLAPVVPSHEMHSLQHFKDAASPEAYRLAAHIAAVSPASVPVMRLVQSAVPWEARTAHLAEVFLGGLVHPLPAPVPGPLPTRHQIFDFTEEAKSALLDAVPSAELLRTSRRIGQRLEQLAGRSPDFPAWLVHPEGTEELPPAFRSFTAVERRLMLRFGVRMEPPTPEQREPRPVHPTAGWRRLTPRDPVRLGPYRLYGRRPGKRTVVYLGRGRQGEEAAIRVVRPELPPSQVQLLRTEAEALRRMEGRYAPALLATGLDEQPAWLAMQPVKTQRLSDVLGAGAGGEAPAAPLDILTSLTLGWHLAGAVSLCHLKGLVPAVLSADSIVLQGRSVLMAGLSDCVVDGTYSGTGRAPTPADNVRELGLLLKQISGKRRRTNDRYAVEMLLWEGDTWQPLRELVLRCLAADPEERPTAGEVAGVLARYVSMASAMRQTAPLGSGEDGGGHRSGALPLSRPPLVPRPAWTSAPRPPRPGRWSARLGFGRVAEHDRLSRIARPLSHSRHVVLVGAYPGCGRVTTAFALGAVFAAVREAPVLALDAAPAAGDLYNRLVRRNPATPRDLITLPPDCAYEDMRRFTTRTPSGLEVLAHSATHSAPSPAYRDEYRRIVAMASRHYPVILSDWGAARVDESADLVLDLADRMVLCCTATTSSVAVAKDILATVRESGRRQLADHAVIAVARIGGHTGELRDGVVAERFHGHVGGAVLVPFDTHLSSSRELDLTRLRRRTADAFLDLAARLAGPD